MTKPNHPIARLAVLLVALLMVFGTAGCGGGNGSSGGGNASPGRDAAQGQPPEGPAETVSLYRTHCLSCHGSDLSGNMGPATDIRQVGARLDRDAIRRRIAEGGDMMPAFANRLADEEIDALADWLSTLK